jgi:hypothetical protein
MNVFPGTKKDIENVMPDYLLIDDFLSFTSFSFFELYKYTTIQNKFLRIFDIS